MSWYVSQHPDYTDAERLDYVDRPTEPLIVEAPSSRHAMKRFHEMEPDISYEDLQSETTLVLLDPVLEKLRTMGWTIQPPTK